MITSPPHSHFEELSALVTDRGNARITHERVRIGKNLTLAAQFGQQARSQLGTGSRQRIKQVMIGMLLKSLFDPAAVFIQLALERFQQRNQTQSQQTLGVYEAKVLETEARLLRKLAKKQGFVLIPSPTN